LPNAIALCPAAHCAAGIAHCRLGGAESIIFSAGGAESMMLSAPYPQNIELPIKIIANNCQLKLTAGLEKRQLIAVSPTII
jgi:hypothetical protein